MALSTWAAAAPVSDDDVVAVKLDRVSTRPSWASPAVSPSLRVVAVCRFVGLYPWRGRMGSFVPRWRQVFAVRRGYLYSEAAPAMGAAARRLVYSYLVKSGWSLSFGVSLLLVESPADLGVPVLLRLGDGFYGRSSTQECIDCFGAPFAAKVGSKKLKWLLQKLPRRVGAQLQVVGSSFLSSREGALAGGSDHQH